MRIRLNHGRLLELIAGSKISQNHWAIRLGLARGHWSNIVQGKHPYPSAKTRTRLLEAFGVSFEDLFAYEAAGGADATFQAAIADRYVIEREVGQGGMGTVYRARDVRLGRTVALKIVSDEAVSGIGVEQFVKEIRYTARLQHHHILPLYDAGEAAGCPYYVTPFIEGGSLRDLLRQRGPLPLDDVVHMVNGIAEALAFAHDRHVLHCDVKPENVLLSGRGPHVFVSDFGIARAIHAETLEWGTRHEIDSSAGTPAYVSPEQASGERRLDARSDVYSLGCMVFEMVSGRAPFEGTTTMEIVAKRFVEAPVLSAYAPHVPRAVGALLGVAMSVESDARPESAAVFARRLADAASQRPHPAFERAARVVVRGVERARQLFRSPTSRRRQSVMDTVVQDIRFAVRGLRRSPGFSLITILTLALGIGANTAIFSVVNGILLDPLPFPESDRVVVLREVNQAGDVLQVSPPNFLDWRERNTSFATISFSWFFGWQTVLGGVTPVRTIVEAVGRDFTEVFRITPVLGRSIAADENRPGGEPTALVSHQFWRTHLAADSNLSAHTLDIDGTLYQVVGVMPPGFRLQGDSDVWIPGERLGLPPSRTTFLLRVVGRLRSGVAPDDAQRAMSDLVTQIRAESPQSEAVGVDMRAIQEELVGTTRRPLLVLLAAAGFLLLIACTNVSSTLLARGMSREREFVLRVALGARKARIVQQLLTESLVLAVAGGVVGLALAATMVWSVTTLAPATLARLDNVRLDLAVLGFAMVTTLLTVVLVGLWPALRGAGHGAAHALRAGGTGGTPNQGRMWSMLIGVEVAFAIVLVVGSGLLIKSFWTLLQVDAGFDPHGVLTVEYSLPPSTYPEAAVSGFHQRVIAEIGSIPGVRHVGIVNHLPLSGLNMFAGLRTVDSPNWTRADYRLASGGYFAAMRTPLLRGRAFNDGDRPGAPHAMVINQRLAEEMWPGEDPLGKQVMLSGNDRQFLEPLTVIGVAANVRHRRLSAIEPPTYYVHYLQRPLQGRTVVAAVRADGEPARLIPTVRARVRALDPNVPLEFASMTSRLSQSVADRRFTVLVLATLAGVALTLAAVGIFGVVSYTVARRNRELGIRLALGATPGRIRTMIVRQSMTIVAGGAVVGVGLALVAGRFLQSLLFGVEATDPFAFGIGAFVLGIAALLASYIPARRTTKVDPMVTIRMQ